ncbi:MAG: hypothetical protein IKY98_01250 [Alphaproteobacteria bacterium]|nr:hypothetical protein [Alphaproteobacteria bacterium]
MSNRADKITCIEGDGYSRAIADGIVVDRFYYEDGSKKTEHCSATGSVTVNYGKNHEPIQTDIINEQGSRLMSIDYDSDGRVSKFYLGSHEHLNSPEHSMEIWNFKNVGKDTVVVGRYIGGPKECVYIDTNNQNGMKEDSVYADTEHTKLLRKITYNTEKPSKPDTIEIYDKDGNISVSLKCDKQGRPQKLTEYLDGKKKETSFLIGRPHTTRVIYDNEPEKSVGYEYVHVNVQKGLEVGIERSVAKAQEAYAQSHPEVVKPPVIETHKPIATTLGSATMDINDLAQYISKNKIKEKPITPVKKTPFILKKLKDNTH